MTDPRGNQATEMAHLRRLNRCRTCGAAATEALYTGLNDLVGVYCTRHAKGALAKWKAGTLQ
jgi:hypothetical protein